MKRGLAVLCSFALAACTLLAPGPGTISKGDAQGQVRAKLGAPTAERKLASGDLAWYYATGPYGFDTWRVVFDRGGAVAEYMQMLTAASFSAIGAGASRDAVLDRLGPPMQTMSFARTATEAWTYRWKDGTLEMIADAVFDARGGGLKHIALYRDPAYESGQSVDR